MKVYIAGPVTHATPEQLDNFKACGKWWKSQKLHHYIDPVEKVRNVLGENASHDAAMKVCLKELLNCDAICMLPGWEDSDGACLEYQCAVAVGMPVILWGGV